MQTLSRLRIVSLLLVSVLLVLLGEVGCSNKTTDPILPPDGNDNNPDNNYSVTNNIFFTGSDFRGPPVQQYAYGDSIYIKSREEMNLRPTLSPVSLHSYVHGDKEIFLMDSDRAPPSIFPENYLAVIAILPEVMTGYGPFTFDGTLTVEAGGDSITAYYFSQNHGQLFTAGVRIGEF